MKPILADDPTPEELEAYANDMEARLSEGWCPICNSSFDPISLECGSYVHLERVRQDVTVMVTQLRGEAERRRNAG